MCGLGCSAFSGCKIFAVAICWDILLLKVVPSSTWGRDFIWSIWLYMIHMIISGKANESACSFRCTVMLIWVKFGLKRLRAGAAGRGRWPYAHVPPLSAGSASGSPKNPQKSPSPEQIPIKFQPDCLSRAIQELSARAELLKELWGWKVGVGGDLRGRAQIYPDFLLSCHSTSWRNY